MKFCLRKSLLCKTRTRGKGSSPHLTDTGTQRKKEDPMEAKKREHPVYTEQYKSQAVELMIHSGKSVVQIARELGCSEASLHGWKKAYLKGQQPGQIDGQQQRPEQMAQTIRQLHKEVEYLKRQREILKKAMSIVGEEPNPGMR